MEIGIDIEEIDRIKKAHSKWGNKFLDRIFSIKEIEYCFNKSNPYPSLCGKFCAKEAIIKTYNGKIFFNDIEIINQKSGKPMVYINKKESNIKLSISHSRQYAAAVAIRE